ncbi:uncharacterized protein LOC141638885 [Silene latifolia]|uniref:uncharacterized protein LOC141638885 n=1 Tax=Silene latifolia TaxID=37657 RepID=UPI003D775CDF
MASTKKKMTIMTVLFVILMSWTTTKAQDISAGETCIQALVPCVPYLGFSNPPPVCCDPLKMAIQTQLPCLCAVISDPTLGTMFNMTQVLQLPQDCGIKDVGPSMCTQGTPSSGSSSTPAPSTSTSSKTSPSSEPTPSAATSSSKTPPSPPLGNGSSRSIALAGPISSLMLLFTVLTFY